MNSFERYLHVMQGKPADVLPRIPILMRFAAEYIGSNYGAFASDYRVLVEANLRCAKDFGMDQVSAISDPYRETHGFGADIEYQRDGVPKCLRPPLEGTKDIASLPRPNPQAGRMLDRVNAIRAYKEQVQGEYSILGWVEGPAAEAADVRGVSTFLVDMFDDPPFCEALMDICVDVAIEFARAQIEAGADTIGIGDAIASQVSPRLYNRLIQPREKRLVQAIREMGAYVRLHICGNITHLLPGIADLPINILDVDHVVDMKAARAAVGADVVLAGNIDPAGGVLYGTPQAIRAAMQAAYQAVGNRYMVCAGCEIPSGTPHEHLKALCEPIPYCA